jgi:putative ABC transport system substrate-binding protein
LDEFLEQDLFGALVGQADEVAGTLRRHLQVLDLAEVALQAAAGLEAAAVITFIRAERIIGRLGVGDTPRNSRSGASKSVTPTSKQRLEATECRACRGSAAAHRARCSRQKSRCGSFAVGRPQWRGAYGRIRWLTHHGRNLLRAARCSHQPHAELKAQGAQIFVTAGYPTTAATKAAGLATVAYTGAGDPVATGLIESWTHPGGLVTGISDIAATLTVKRLEFLKALSPNLKRVAILWNADDRAMTLRYEASAATAQLQGLIIQGLGVREPDDFNGAFEAMDHDKPDAILMVSDALMILNRKRIIDFAAARRLPAIYEADNYARDGGLMSYGADVKESLTRAAAMVDRIFKGTRPGDIPFEQPTRYLFVMNLKVARAMGLEPPVTLLGLADEVIE